MGRCGNRPYQIEFVIAFEFGDLPGATSPCTNPISGAQQFFRLISN